MQVCRCVSSACISSVHELLVDPSDRSQSSKSSDCSGWCSMTSMRRRDWVFRSATMRVSPSPSPSGGASRIRFNGCFSAAWPRPVQWWIVAKNPPGVSGRVGSRGDGVWIRARTRPILRVDTRARLRGVVVREIGFSWRWCRRRVVRGVRCPARSGSEQRWELGFLRCPGVYHCVWAGVPLSGGGCRVSVFGWLTRCAMLLRCA